MHDLLELADQTFSNVTEDHHHEGTELEVLLCRYELAASVSSYSHMELNWRWKDLLQSLQQLQFPMAIAQKESVYIHQLFLV